MASDETQSSAAINVEPRWIRKAVQAFRRTAHLVRGFLEDRYGEEDAAALVRDAEARYADLLPRVPWVKGRRGTVLNSFLGITAQEIAVYQAIEAQGGSASEAWEVCHQALRLRLARTPRWKRWLMSRLLFSALVRRIVKRREARDELLRAGDFETRSMLGHGAEFDLGVDYVRCGNLELARKVGADAFAPYLCMSDVALSDAFGWGLIRTQTLADGCSHCDFRFKQGGATRISSPTPEVQETIDRIAREESRETRAAEEKGEHRNVALLRKFDPGNFSETDDLFAEHVVWHYFNPLLPEIHGDYVGRSRIRAFFEKITTVTDGTFLVEPLSITAVGDELLVAQTKNSMRIADQQIETDVVVVWRVVDGRVVEVWDIPSVCSESHRSTTS